MNESHRVLVVEDEAMVAMLIEDMLLDLGHKVVALAGNMKTAEQWIRDGEFDFAILDVNLNGVQTYSLAKILRARGKPFLFATGYGYSGLRQEESSVPVLQKPFQIRQLQAAIGELGLPGSAVR